MKETIALRNALAATYQTAQQRSNFVSLLKLPSGAVNVEGTPQDACLNIMREVQQRSLYKVLNEVLRLDDRTHIVQLVDHWESSSISESTKNIPWSTAGLIAIREIANKNNGFQQFLNEQSLPYFSRDAYFEEVGGERPKISESAIIDDINRTTQNAAILLSGPGGVGKTRLAREICQKCQASSALQVTSEIDYGRFNTLLQQSDGIRQLVLFLDYAETFTTPSTLAETITALYEEKRISTSLILSTRSSNFDRVQQNFEDLDPRVFKLAQSNSTVEVAYQTWLVEKILEHFGLRAREDLARICGGHPFLAVFAGHLSKTEPDKFDAQFSLATDNPSFKTWAAKRIESFAKTPLSAHERLSQIALALPFHTGQRSIILDDNAGVGEDLFDTLLEDRWVEQIDGQFSAIHDSLADAMVADWLFRKSPTRRLRKLLGNSAERHYFLQSLRMLARIKDHERFSEINRLNVLQEVSERSPSVIQQCAHEIIQSVLLSADHIYEALEQVEGLYEGLSGDLKAIRTLTRLLASVGNKNEIVPGSKLARLLQEAAGVDDQKVIANLLRFDAVTYERAAVRSIVRGVSEKDASFSIVSFLYEVGLSKPIDVAIFKWMDRFYSLPRAGLVLWAWYESSERYIKKLHLFDRVHEGRRRELAVYLKKWCLAHTEKYYAFRPLQALIALKPDDEEMWAICRTWLSTWSTSRVSGYVMQRIFELQSFSRVELKGFALRWLSVSENRGDVTEVLILLWSMCKAGLLLDDFQDFLMTVITNGAAAIKARRDACAYWLFWGGDPQRVKDTLANLIAESPIDEHVRVAIEAWLTATKFKDRSFVSQTEAWLRGNSKHPEAYRHILWWMNMGLDIENIEPIILDWLSSNPRSQNYTLIYLQVRRAAPEMAQRISLSDEEVRIWLRRMDREIAVRDNVMLEHMVSTLSSFSHEISEAVIAKSAEYLNRFGDLADSAFLISKLLDNAGRIDWVQKCADSWLASFPGRGRCCLVLQSLLSAGCSTDLIRPKIMDWLEKYPRYEKAGYLFLTWIEVGGCKSALKEQVGIWLPEASRKDFSEFERVRAAFG